MWADVAAGVNILAGATLGGGTRVNWQASFQTPEHVRREWAEEHGLPALQSERYDRALRAVWTRLGVTTGAPNKLWYSAVLVPMDGMEEEHCCSARLMPQGRNLP